MPNQQKLGELAEIEGFASVEELLETCVHDSVSPGICTRDGCDYTCEVEPDQDRGWCEECKAPSVKAALVLAELI